MWLKSLIGLGLALLIVGLPADLSAQNGKRREGRQGAGKRGTAKQREAKEREEEFVNARPTIGDPLPVTTVYTSDGKPVSTADLRGHYTVLTFGCLT